MFVFGLGLASTIVIVLADLIVIVLPAAADGSITITVVDHHHDCGD